MSPDPNWLLSTCAQSAAAIVAIIGGFIATRVLSLSTERNGIELRLKEAVNNLRLKQEMLDEVNDKIIMSDVNDFLDNAIQIIIEKGGEMPLKDLIEKYDPDVEEERILPYYNKVIETTKRAYKFFEDNTELLAMHDFPRKMEDFLNEIKIKIPNKDKDIYQGVYKLLREEYFKGSNLFYVPDIGAIKGIANISSISENQRYNQLIESRDLLESDCKILDAQIKDLKDRLIFFGRTSGLGWGMLCLIYFSLSGIVFPIFLTPICPEQFTEAHKWSVFGLFVSGLVAVFLYLGISIIQLSKRD